ncbi:MAG: OmpA family protein [Saprospiraceae bacterium]|nr:OmpA family protein [Saprospiraceae bacterium]
MKRQEFKLHSFWMKLNFTAFGLWMILNCNNIFAKENAALVFNSLDKIEILKSNKESQQNNDAIGTIYFGCGKSRLNKTAKKEMEKLLLTLQKFPETMISIEGHSDSKEILLKIKTIRTASAGVRRFSNFKNISSDRIMSRGFGSTKPAVDTDTSAGRKLNRRTEFYLISK